MTVGPTFAWARDEWSPESAYEQSEYNNAKPIIDSDEEEDENEEV